MHNNLSETRLQTIRIGSHNMEVFGANFDVAFRSDIVCFTVTSALLSTMATSLMLEVIIVDYDVNFH